MGRRSVLRDLLLLAAAAFAVTAPAAPRPNNSPEETAYREVAAAVDGGDLARAQTLIDSAGRRFAGSRSCWVWGILILSSNRPIVVADWKAAKRALDPAPPAGCASSEPNVRRLVLRAWVASRTKKPYAGDIEAATRLAASYGAESQVLADWMHASILTSEGRYTRSNQLVRQALPAAQQHGLELLEAKLKATIARTLTFQERFDEAAAYSESALALCRKHNLDIQAERIIANLSWLYVTLGDFDLADERAQEADRLAAKISEIDRIAPLTMRGNVRLYQRRYDEARPFYEEALRIAVDKEDPRRGECLENLALLALEKRDYDTADAIHRQAVASKSDADDLRARIVEGRIAAGRGQAQEAERLFRSVATAATIPSARWEASGRLGMLYAALGKADLAEKNFRAMAQTAQDVRASLKEDQLKLGYESNLSEFTDAYIGMLVERGRVERSLAVCEAARARTLAEGLHLHESTKTRDEKQVAAEARAVVLSYRLMRGRSFLWVVTAKNVDVIPLPDVDAIDKAVRGYQQQLLGPPSETLTADGAGASLYRMLVKPAEKWLAGAPRVVVIPDGALNALNMEALVVPSPKPHYWIEDATIFTASSLQFLGGAQGKVRTSSLLLVGNAVSCDKDFPALTNADKEMTDVSRHFDRVRKIQQKDATPAAYETTAVGAYDVVHFVAHGAANRVQPLQSAVVLSCARDGSYKLYGRDIMKHRLRAQLVTISSCRSAGNRSYAGEGLVGLAWAFLRAGAQQVVAALWDVNDRATPVLMDEFYAQLRAGKDAPAALRAAKLKLIGRGQRPVYWAPFVLYSGA